jgi:hypothetical protein
MALFVFSVLAPWWPNQESDWAEIWSASYSYQVVHMYNISGQLLQRLQNGRRRTPPAVSQKHLFYTLFGSRVSSYNHMLSVVVR